MFENFTYINLHYFISIFLFYPHYSLHKYSLFNVLVSIKSLTNQSLFREIQFSTTVCTRASEFAAQDSRTIDIFYPFSNRQFVTPKSKIYRFSRTFSNTASAQCLMRCTTSLDNQTWTWTYFLPIQWKPWCLLRRHFKGTLRRSAHYHYATTTSISK